MLTVKDFDRLMAEMMKMALGGRRDHAQGRAGKKVSHVTEKLD